MTEQETKWRELCAAIEAEGGEDYTRCANCGEPLEFSNEYGRQWGTCDSQCYGEMVGVYTARQYAGAEEY